MLLLEREYLQINIIYLENVLAPPGVRIKKIIIRLTQWFSAMQRDKLKEDKAHVFKRFYRIESANKGFKAFVGLYLCPEIVNRNGGSIGVDSDLLQDITFTFFADKR